MKVPPMKILIVLTAANLGLLAWHLVLGWRVRKHLAEGRRNRVEAMLFLDNAMAVMEAIRRSRPWPPLGIVPPPAQNPNTSHGSTESRPAVMEKPSGS
jgi:hypothetical protein